VHDIITFILHLHIYFKFVTALTIFHNQVIMLIYCDRSMSARRRVTEGLRKSYIKVHPVQLIEFRESCTGPATIKNICNYVHLCAFKIKATT